MYIKYIYLVLKTPNYKNCINILKKPKEHFFSFMHIGAYQIYISQMNRNYQKLQHQEIHDSHSAYMETLPTVIK